MESISHLKPTRRDLVFLILAGLFITNALVAEIIGGKLIQIGPFTVTMGTLPWPIVFIVTDLINEYFGKTGVRRLTFLTVGLILYTFAILYASIPIEAVSFSPVSKEMFQAVFGQSLWIIVGSVAAFLFSQLIDVAVFTMFKNKTKEKMLWLRATGSTVVSQLIDSFVVLGIAFWLPGKVDFGQFMSIAFANYSYKFIVAIALTPLIYAAHKAIDRYLRQPS